MGLMNHMPSAVPGTPWEISPQLVPGIGLDPGAPNFASQMLGIEWFLEFAVSVGAIDERERIHLREVAAEALRGSAARQDTEQVEEKPVERFRQMTEAALLGAQAYIADRDGNPPRGREAACGWKSSERLNSAGPWEADGDLIGWIDGDDVWLKPELAYRCVEKLSQGQNRSLGLTQGALGKRLDEAGWLKSRNDDHLASKVRIKGALTRCWHLSVKLFLPFLINRD